jgi:hypothetical protein
MPVSLQKRVPRVPIRARGCINCDPALLELWRPKSGAHRTVQASIAPQVTSVMVFSSRREAWRVVPAGSLVWTRAGGGEKVTREPESLHGDFPETCRALCLQTAAYKNHPYALTRASYPPPCSKPAIGTGTAYCTDSGRLLEQYSLDLATAPRIAALVRALPAAF